MSKMPEAIVVAAEARDAEEVEGEGTDDGPLVHDDDVAPPTAGQTASTTRDMQKVTDHYDERPTIDIRHLEKAIDMLVAIREEDLRTRSKPWTPKHKSSAESIQDFMKKTKENKATAERYLDEVGGDLEEALRRWIKTPVGISDYDTKYGKSRGPIVPLSQV